MDRRDFVQLASLGVCALAWPVRARAGSPAGSRQRLLSAWVDAAGCPRGGRAGMGEGALLPTRGHGLVVDPLRPAQVIVVARRPGYWIARIDVEADRLLVRRDAEEERHGYGHGVLSRDGALLYTSENNLDTGAGLISVRDAATLAVLRELPSHGIGPHELCLLADGKTLAVANGGILTFPETGRLKINAGHMQPSLALVDVADGRLVAKHTLADSRLSIRHLAAAADGTLGIALQSEPALAGAPVFAVLREGRLQLGETAALGGYASSIAANGERFGLTCLHGDAVVSWDARGRLKHRAALSRPVGIAAWGEGYVVTSELGDLVELDGELKEVARSKHPGRKWDNHLVAG